jgi:D-alanine-D-alanine ligase-like ATP-grasp enzyme
MKKKKSDGPLLGKIFRAIAPKIGARIVIEPEWNIVGQIIFKNGRKRYFRYSTLDLNPVGASDVAKDKDYANFFMKKMGYPTIPGTTFFSKQWADAIGSKKKIDAGYRYAKKIGFPVIVKPNSGSQGVAVAKAHTKKDFYQAMRNVFMHDRIALVQTPVAGKDYRVVVLDNKIISAYERIPLNITGNGTSTVKQLLAQKQKQFVKTGRDTIIRAEDKRVAQKLKRRGLTMRSVIPRGETVYLLDNANLSTGGDAIDVTATIHPAFRKLAIQLTRDMGLRFCGVDIIVDGDGIETKPDRYWIIEVNAAPGLDHYVTTGKTQRKIVEDMYLEVLKALE